MITYPAEGGYKFRWITVRKQVAAHSTNGAGIQHRVDSRLAVISHDGTDKLLPCVILFFRLPIHYFYMAVVVFQIGRVGVCTQIAPLTKYRIAYISIMRFIGVGVEDHI